MRPCPLFSSLTCFAAVVLCSCLVPRSASADPTAQEQYWLELVNQARRDPAGELERLVNYSSPTTFANPASDNPDVAAALAFFGTSASALATQWASLSAAPALAWSDALRTSAVNYSGLMVSHDQQSHTLDGLSLDQRILNGGYGANYLDLGENLYASAKSAFHGHAGFMIDWGDSDTNGANGYGTGIQNPASHRQLLFDKYFKQVGIGTITSGIPTTNLVANGPVVVTQHLGSLFRVSGTTYISDAILTGVVYTDDVLANNFYTPGEGLSGETIQVYNNATNALLYSGTTNSVGGYNISLPGVTSGQVLRISASGLGLADQLVTISGFTEPAATYGAPVTFYNNVYAAFAVVPEPSSVLLIGGAFATFYRRRIRRPARPVIVIKE